MTVSKAKAPAKEETATLGCSQKSKMIAQQKDALFGAAVLKLSFSIKKMLDTPGFTFVYQGTLRELGVTDAQVDRYISKHKAQLMEHLEQMNTPKH